MSPKKPNGIRQYVLDTNVLVNDPRAPFKFDEHTVIICMQVLEELDKLKDSRDPKREMASRDARLAIKCLGSIIGDATSEELNSGVPIGDHKGAGRLRVINDFDVKNVTSLPSHVPDNKIIAAALKLDQDLKLATTVRTNEGHSPSEDEMGAVVLVSNDMNIRIKALAAGLDHVEDFKNEQAIDNIDVMAKGHVEIDDDFTMTMSNVEVKRVDGFNAVFIPMSEFNDTMKDIVNGSHLNQYWYNSQSTYRVKEISEKGITLIEKTVKQMMGLTVFGLSPRSLLQAMAMDALMDETVSVVNLIGGAGSGKTILSLACAMEQSPMGENPRYKKIILARNTPPLAEDIGFLPGDESEKMAPWLAGFDDALEVLFKTDTTGHSKDKMNDKDGFSQTIAYAKEKANIRAKSVSFLRGASIQDSLLILDEAQNLSAHQVKTIISRMGQGSKIIVLGDVTQIDVPYLDALNCGLTSSTEKLKHFKGGTCVTLKGSERSELAAFVEEFF